VLTGWFAGPKADTVSSLTASELVDMGLASLAVIFDLPLDRIRRDLVASRAINWGDDPFARGAYSTMPAWIWARSRRRWRADKKQRRRETAQMILAAGP
jgi:hypothetical protein